MPRANNPPWTRNELILALDVYLRYPTASKTHAAVVELSDLLQRVGPKVEAGDPDRFRNPNSVGMKLGNFKAVDPASPSGGLTHGGRRAEQEIWDEFAERREALAAEVVRIKAAAGDGSHDTESPTVAPAADDLTELAVRPRNGGQGYVSDVRRKEAVEHHAVDLATQHFEGDGWTVEDVGATESYDLLCHRAGVELHVEVKGTTTDGATVALTANEVLHAELYEHVALAIVSHIEVTSSPEPTATGGTLTVHQPWRMDPSRLRARVYTYEVPSPEGGPVADVV